jgi:glycosyltransferase involved in cell wall biosynthesis
MRKIAFIVQQYGLEMYGGAELHCMRLAEKMVAHYNVEVLTTCSFDFLTWADYYTKGESKINGVTVRRFGVSQQRSWEKMTELEKKVKTDSSSGKKWLKRLVNKIFSKLAGRTPKKEDCINWIVAQGPTAPGLISFIKENEKAYDCLIFFSYLYYPTVFGIDIAPQKTILIPLAHDEWAMRMPIFKEVFTSPACIMYNTAAEKKLVNKLFHNEKTYSEVTGIGIDIPVNLQSKNIAGEWGINSPYILYVGRIDSNKITPQDFEWFLQYNKDKKKNIRLILIGNLYIDIPENNLITHLGFVDDQAKFNLIKQSLFLFQPSRFESLSLVVLEAFAMEKPVLVHMDCEVMKEHIDDSRGGFYYNDYNSFSHAFNQLTDNIVLNTAMGKAGKKYIDKNYRWESIIAKFKNVIESKIHRSI